MANEIELMVSIRRQGDSGLKRRGDVITCRLAGGKWGSEEIKGHQIVTWPGENASDEELLASQLLMLILGKKIEWGEPNPRVDFPFYEVVDENVEDDNGKVIRLATGEKLFRRAMTNRSVLHFDFSNLPEQQLNDIFDESKVAESLSADTLDISIDKRGIDKRQPADRGIKAHRDILEENPVLHADTALRRDQTTNIEEYISQDKKPIDSWSI